VTVDPTGHYVYAAAYIDGAVSALSIGADGALTLIGTVVTGGGSTSNSDCITVDPAGHYAYVANQTDGTISAFSIGTDGTLTLIGTVMTGSGATSGPISVTTAF
jgi:6-phosphogluconolactonase (cycloisomerase 2 family)